MRKLRPEVQADYRTQGGLWEIFDNEIITAFNITIDEIEFISGKMTEEEENMVTSSTTYSTFSGCRKVIELRNKYLKMYNDDKKPT